MAIRTICHKCMLLHVSFILSYNKMWEMCEQKRWVWRIVGSMSVTKERRHEFEAEGRRERKRRRDTARSPKKRRPTHQKASRLPSHLFPKKRKKEDSPDRPTPLWYKATISLAVLRPSPSPLFLIESPATTPDFAQKMLREGLHSRTSVILWRI